MPLNALPDELGRDWETLGDALGRLALGGTAGRLPADGLAAGRAAPAPAPVVGRLKLEGAGVVVGRVKLEVVAGRVVAPGCAPEPQPRACALVADVLAPDLLSRLWSGCHFVWPAGLRLMLLFWL